MVVQHNLTAMNSNRMLGLTTAAQAKSTEKLSSGYKINRAADDAAGLAISEKMRKQIRGLTQASANAQDGISAVQTAEGALTEVHDMLQRMNELAVKAANGTNSESDRTAIQQEIDQLVTEIDRVAETTKFNETYLLKGDKSVSKQYSYSYGAVGTSVAASATMDQDAATGLSAAITFTSGASASDQNALAKALQGQGITVASETTTKADGTTATKFSISLNGSAASNYNVNTISDNQFEIVDLQGNQIATVVASENPAAADGADDAGDADGADGTGGTATITAGTTIYDAEGTALDADALAAALDADPAAALYKDAPTKGTCSNDSLTVDALPTGAAIGTVYTYDGAAWKDGEGNTATGITVSGGTANNGDKITVAFDADAATAAVKDTDYTYTAGTTDTDNDATANVAAKAGTQLYDVVGNTIDMTTAAASVAANQNLTGALSLKLHVGADATADNQISLNIEAMSAKGLGVNGLKVDGTDDASALSAIETIKEAIQRVSSQRSDLGAVQNRLEHTINNLDNVVENTTSAESAIRDTDMATEMVKYSNNNILAQAGQAMLAQANQSNQGVLSLLG